MLMNIKMESTSPRGSIFFAPKASWDYLLQTLENPKFSDFIYEDSWYLNQLVKLHYYRQDVVESMFSSFCRELINKDASRLKDIKSYLNKSTPEEITMYTGFIKTPTFMKFVDPKSKIFSSKGDVFLYLCSHKETQEFIGKDWDLFKTILKLNASEGIYTFSILENSFAREIINKQIDRLIILAKFDNPEKIIDILSNETARAYINKDFDTLTNLLFMTEEELKQTLGLQEHEIIFSTPAGTFEANIGSSITKSQNQLEKEIFLNNIFNLIDKVLPGFSGSLSGEKFTPEPLKHTGDTEIFHFID